jgi:hypothetical protein
MYIAETRLLKKSARIAVYIFHILLDYYITARLQIFRYVHISHMKCPTDMNRSSYHIATFFRYYLTLSSVEAVVVPPPRSRKYI